MNMKFYDIITSITIWFWKEYKNSFINNFIFTIIKDEKLAILALIFLNFVIVFAILRASFPETLITAKPEIPGAVASANIDIKK